MALTLRCSSCLAMTNLRITYGRFAHSKMRNIHFLERQLIFGTVRVSAFAAGVREQLVTGPPI